MLLTVPGHHYFARRVKKFLEISFILACWVVIFCVRVFSFFNACWCLLAPELTISVFVRMSASGSSDSMVIFRFANCHLPFCQFAVAVTVGLRQAHAGDPMESNAGRLGQGLLGCHFSRGVPGVPG